MELSYEEIKTQLMEKFDYKPYHFREVENRNLQDKMTEITNKYITECNWTLSDSWHFAGVDLGVFYIGG